MGINVHPILAFEQALLAGFGKKFRKRKNESLCEEGNGGGGDSPLHPLCTGAHFFFAQTFSPNPQGEAARRLIQGKIPTHFLLSFQFLKTLPVPQFLILNPQIFSTY